MNFFLKSIPVAVAGGSIAWSAAEQPNIIIIFTDDHGFTDLGVHGVDPNVRTPVLDSLANGGALMRNGYCTAPQCVPSRAGLMSGRIQNTFGTRDNGIISRAGAVPLDVPTLAERLKTLGYRTGMVGKWHLNPLPEAGIPAVSYQPAQRGFDEYWNGANTKYQANFDLNGNTVHPPQTITDGRNRVVVQGEAAQAFIQRNHAEPFFLYLALYGPHWPRISADDPYYQNFPVLDYPNYSPEMDDIRRFGLALVHAIDDAVGGVMLKLRDLGLEENTLILFSGDNGAPPKFWNAVGGAVTLESWTGSENVPLRGEKGSLWEGGIKVPMFAYWKNRIPAGQVIEEPVSTLDFAATVINLAGTGIPPEFDGADILPHLTGAADSIQRATPLFWDWGQEIAMRKDDWKIHRIGARKSLFNLAEDPLELYDLKYQHPEKFQEMEADLMAWYNALPPAGRSPLIEKGDNLYVTGAPDGTPPDERFLIPYTNAAPAAYPAPLLSPDAPPDEKPPEPSVRFEFDSAGDFEGWIPVNDGFLDHAEVSGGILSGRMKSNQGKLELRQVRFSADRFFAVDVRIKSPAGSALTFRWGHTGDDTFHQSRTLSISYSSGEWQTVRIPLQGHSEWDGKTVTRLRLNPVNKEADFEIDWIRAQSHPSGFLFRVGAKEQ
ncbi:MAG: sulfatase-like hydrolase/transferase [Kiritimatiellales bacterium]